MIKNTKVCFNKSVGILIIVTIALCTFAVFAFQLTTKPTSTSTRASAPVKNILPILDGEKADDGEFPFHATLFNKEGMLFCGGTLINKYWVLTAAHCIDGNPLEIEVMIGLDHLDTNLKALHYSKVDKFYVDGYDVFTDITKNDRGLLHLETPAEGVPTASIYYYQPVKGRNNISVSHLEEYLEDLHKPITIIGYGRTVYNNIYRMGPSDLMKRTNGLMVRTETDITKKYKFYVEPVATWLGDSGSPALSLYKDHMYVVGLVNGAGTREYSSFISISYYYQWIHDKSVEYAKLLSSDGSDQIITANSGTYKKDDPVIATHPIPICTDISNLIDCKRKKYLCEWNFSFSHPLGACVNNPNRDY